jgi:hypothetical protein
VTTHAFRASPDLSRAIEDRCIQEGINKSELIIKAIQRYLSNEVQPSTRANIHDRFEALEHEMEEIKEQLKTISHTDTEVDWKEFISKHHKLIFNKKSLSQ